jgi:hypothetical protein
LKLKAHLLGPLLLGAINKTIIWSSHLFFFQKVLTIYKFRATFIIMKSIVIPVHSFVDLITNSSSETYVTTSEKSVEAIKNLIKLFLEKSSNLTLVDELFDVKCMYSVYNDETGKDEEFEGTSIYYPSYIRITTKPGVTGYNDLIKALTDLNNSFSAEEFRS